jgi:hypothetical protein
LNFPRGLLKVAAQKAVIVNISKYGAVAVFSGSKLVFKFDFPVFGEFIRHDGRGKRRMI